MAHGLEQCYAPRGYNRDGTKSKGLSCEDQTDTLRLPVLLASLLSRVHIEFFCWWAELVFFPRRRHCTGRGRLYMRINIAEAF